ncbi:hypothetical protein WDJ51_15270 [Rathayibacter sp. YIM 133350]|uniref:hypothetical protein n=1 Tax=Rathayibacter sp. YIM 133350 TaxID=3131992 RepID=UPI00307D8DF6
MQGVHESPIPEEVDERLEELLALQYVRDREAFPVAYLVGTLQISVDDGTDIVRRLVRDGALLCRIRGRHSEHVEYFLTRRGRARMESELTMISSSVEQVISLFSPAERAVIRPAIARMSRTTSAAEP